MIIFNAYYDDEFIGEVQARDSEHAEALALARLEAGLHPDPMPSLVRCIIAK